MLIFQKMSQEVGLYYYIIQLFVYFILIFLEPNLHKLKKNFTIQHIGASYI